MLTCSTHSHTQKSVFWGHIEGCQRNDSCNTSQVIYSVNAAGLSGYRWKMETPAHPHCCSCCVCMFVCLCGCLCVSIELSVAILCRVGPCWFILCRSVYRCGHAVCDLYFFWSQHDWSTVAVLLAIHKASAQLHCSQLQLENCLFTLASLFSFFTHQAQASFIYLSTGTKKGVESLVCGSGFLKYCMEKDWLHF